MGQTEYTAECVRNAMDAAEIGGSRNLAVLAAEVRRLREEVARLPVRNGFVEMRTAMRERIRESEEIIREALCDDGTLGQCGHGEHAAAAARVVAALC